MGWIGDDEKRLFAKLAEIEKRIGDNQKDLDQKLDQIISYLTPPAAVRLVVTINESYATYLNRRSNKMAATKATVDFQLLDNGTATLTATPVDSVGIPTTLPAGTAAAVWTSSNPGLTITVNASDASGLTAVASPTQPPALLTGAIPTCTVTLADGVTTLTGNGDAIDVIAGGPAGFAVVEA